MSNKLAYMAVSSTEHCRGASLGEGKQAILSVSPLAACDCEGTLGYCPVGAVKDCSQMTSANY